jgi:hypothetical protein
MANTIKERPVDPIFAELARMGAQPNGPLWEYFRTLIPSTDKTITSKGEIKLQAPIFGRSEGIGTTVTNLDSTGKLASTDAIAADGTGSPLTGGKRGFNALDANNRLSGSGRNNPVNVAFVPQSSTVLSNDGISHSVTLAGFSQVYGDGTVTYNASSFDPGSFGTWYAWITDPTFSGGVPSIVFDSSPNNQANANGNIPLGKITTVSGSAKTGGGTTGGTTSGGAGGRGYVQ